MNAEYRSKMIAEARKLLGVPYHDHSPGEELSRSNPFEELSNTSCSGFIATVARRALGECAREYLSDVYSMTWKKGILKPEIEPVLPGDLVVFARDGGFGGSPSINPETGELEQWHVMMASEPPDMVIGACYFPDKVVEVSVADYTSSEYPQKFKDKAHHPPWKIRKYLRLPCCRDS